MFDVAMGCYDGAEVISIPRQKYRFVQGRQAGCLYEHDHKIG